MVREPDPRLLSLRERLAALARHIIEAGTGPYLIDDLQLEIHVQFGAVATRKSNPTFLKLLRQAEATRDSSARLVNIGDESVAATSPKLSRN